MADYRQELLDIFCEEYESCLRDDLFFEPYVVTNKAKELANISRLSKHLRDRYIAKYKTKPTTEDMKKVFRAFVQHTFTIQDDFYKSNFSPSFILSMFNQIIMRLKQGKELEYTTDYYKAAAEFQPFKIIWHKGEKTFIRESDYKPSVHVLWKKETASPIVQKLVEHFNAKELT